MKNKLKDLVKFRLENHRIDMVHHTQEELKEALQSIYKDLQVEGYSSIEISSAIRTELLGKIVKGQAILRKHGFLK